MIKLICTKIAQAFPPLPPLPVRPLLGAGATVGPVRPAVVCIAIACAPSATAPPAIAELIPRAEPAPVIKQSLTTPDHWRGARPDHLSPVAVPSPGALALFGVGVAALLLARRA